MNKKHKNLIITSPKLIPSQLCDEIKDFFINNKKDQFNSQITANKGSTESSIRNSKELMLCWGDKEHNILLNKLLNIIKPLTAEWFKTYREMIRDVGDTLYEDAHILEYEPNKGFYKYHSDDDGESIKDRILSIIIYLNDVEEGGETEFKYIDIDPIKPNKGDVIMFPSGATHTHRGKVPISNKKYICVVWLRKDD